MRGDLGDRDAIEPTDPQHRNERLEGRGFRAQSYLVGGRAERRVCDFTVSIPMTPGRVP